MRIRLPLYFLLAVLATVSAAVTHAQEKIRHIGLLASQERQCGNFSVREGLRELGYVEGKNILIQCRHASGQLVGLDAAAVDLVRLRPEVIVTLSHVGAEALKKATNDIPVVMVVSGDPVAAGLVESLAQPRRNFTGLTYFASELYAKRLEFLKALVPKLKRVGLLVQPSGSKNVTQSFIETSTRAAQELGLQLVVLNADNSAEIEAAFETMAKTKVQAAHVLSYATFAEEASLIASLSSIHRIPTIHFLHSFPSMGGLMGYGPDYLMLQRRTAVYVDKILKGAIPGELPLEKPTRLILELNASAARDLGLTIPQALLLRADRIIE